MQLLILALGVGLALAGAGGGDASGAAAASRVMHSSQGMHQMHSEMPAEERAECEASHARMDAHMDAVEGMMGAGMMGAGMMGR